MIVRLVRVRRARRRLASRALARRARVPRAGLRARPGLTVGWFDVHAHLTDRRLAAREAQVLDNARAAGVTTIISNGLNPSDNRAVAELAARASRAFERYLALQAEGRFADAASELEILQETLGRLERATSE